MYPSRQPRLPDIRFLIAGDLSVILLFIGAGVVHHGSTDPANIVMTALPFVLGWLLTASLSGIYSKPLSRRTEPFFVIGVWTVAAILGLGIRSTRLFDGGFAPSFGFVIVAGGAAVFVLWRFVIVNLFVGFVHLRQR